MPSQFVSERHSALEIALTCVTHSQEILTDDVSPLLANSSVSLLGRGGQPHSHTHVCYLLLRIGQDDGRLGPDVMNSFLGIKSTPF